jgi:hypothetical protein
MFSAFLRGVLISTAFILACRSSAGAQTTDPSLSLESSIRLKRASERPVAHEGPTVSNGDTLLKAVARWRLRYAAVIVSLESSTAPEWFDPELAATSYLRGTRISRNQMLFAPPGPRRLTLGLERSF